MSPFLSRLLATFISLLLVVFLFLIVSGLLPTISSLYQRFELFIYDQRVQLHLTNDIQVTTPVIIIDIDEVSLQHEGRWPWSRVKIAELVQKLNQAGAAVIGFDILFSEAERNPIQEVLVDLDKPLNFRQQLNALQDYYDRDNDLAKVLEHSAVVLGYLFNVHYPLTKGLLPAPVHVNEIHPVQVNQLVLPSVLGYAAPLEILSQAAGSGGFFNLLPDADGVVRRAALLTRYEDQLYPSLALEMLRQFKSLNSITLKTSMSAGQQHLDSIYLDDYLAFPTDSQGQLLIPFRGPAGTFPYIPAWQVLADEVDPALIQGALVLVSTSASGLFDLRATPVSSVTSDYPDVEIHANLLAAMLDNKFLHQPSWTATVNLTVVLTTGLILALALPWLTSVLQILVSLMVVLVTVSLTSWMWLFEGKVLDLAGPLLLIFLLTLFNFMWAFVYKSMTHQRLADMFGQYVPPQLVEEMSRHPGAFSFEGESRELSVLFSDIRGFTSLSENLAADQLKLLLNRYFNPITRVIFDNRGTVDKYIGDLVMAFWGAPVKDSDHAVNSINAALQMLKVTENISKVFVSEGLPAISVGIGINSGLMNVGDMGSKYRRAYTVLGDAVNLASRLEEATKYYGVTLIVGERTHELALEHFVWRELDLVKVKGKDCPVHVYQPLCPIEELTAELAAELALLDQALQAFRQQNFVQANKLFTQLQLAHPNTYQYCQYLRRLKQLQQEPPAADWDGSWTRTAK